MKHIFLIFALAATPALAQPAPGPITLTPQEFAAVMQELVGQHPGLVAMIQAQERARQQSQASPKPPEPPVTDK
jgi:hypothetical protein